MFLQFASKKDHAWTFAHITPSEILHLDCNWINLCPDQ